LGIKERDPASECTIRIARTSARRTCKFYLFPKLEPLWWKPATRPKAGLIKKDHVDDLDDDATRQRKARKWILMLTQ
jgi:hypothetical protein